MRTTIDGNEAAAHVAYRLNELCSHLPDHAVLDDGRARRRVVEPGPDQRLGQRADRSSRCRARAAPPARSTARSRAGALSTTFTASQGLLLMIPNMYKIAGELTSTVLPRRRPLARRAGRCRSSATTPTSWRCARPASPCSPPPRSRRRTTSPSSPRPRRCARGCRSSTSSTASAPRTSSTPSSSSTTTSCGRSSPTSSSGRTERRALSPERPFVRGTAQNPDVYFQARETVNPFYARTPGVVQEVMDELGEHTGRHYRVVEYAGHPEAERVIVIMGSGGADGAGDGRAPRRAR